MITIIRNVKNKFQVNIFILPTRRKATEALIHKVSNHPRPAFGYAKILLPVKYLIEKLLKITTACQDYQAGECAIKCLSQNTTEWRRF